MMNLQEIKEITIELMHELKNTGLGEVSIEFDDIKIKVEAEEKPQIVSGMPALAAAPVSAAPIAAASVAPAAAEQAAEQTFSGTEVKSPLVGTFYSSPSPDAPPYVLAGQKVKKGDTLCIVEAMKTMNEITAPCDGTVSRILAQPGDMIEYNQTVVIIEE